MSVVFAPNLFAEKAENLLEQYTFEEHIQPLIQQYCYSCHGEGKKLRGDLDLTPYQSDKQVFADRETWLYILEQIETEEMPTKEPLPTVQERQLMVKWIDQRLNDIDWSTIREAGHVTIPRLNKIEYANTLRDLFGLETYASKTFSEDGEGQSGFTTDRDNLFITASDMEKYFRAANLALDVATAKEAPPVSQHLESEKMFMTERSPVQTIQGITGYEINRGQMTLYESIDFPSDGIYQFSVKGLPTVADIGALRLRVNNEPKGELHFQGKEPAIQSISVHVTKGTHQIALNFERSALPPEFRRLYTREYKLGTTLVDWIKVNGPLPNKNQASTSPVFFISPSKNISADDAATQILARFMKRAFRRPVQQEETQRYLSIYQNAIEGGKAFEPAIKLALSAVLVSPNFLFRQEFAPTLDEEEAITKNGGEFALNDYQIASRLSYYLWMSMPDQTLFDLASEGKLREPKVLREQIHRMLQDPKARSFTSTFLGQWLGIQSLGESVIPDQKIFPEFDPYLAQAMKDETTLAFEHLIKNDLNLLALLDSKSTYLNQRLAQHYRIKGVEGPQMRPITLQNRHRGGLLGMASVLTATSSPTRTSPVLRGKWVLETLLGEHVPEPPADAGELSANAGRNNGKTVREELEIHRDHPDCRSCHNRIDPLGFGLEDFDAIGRLRKQANGRPIDNSGIVEGHEFKGTVELKAWLLAERKDAFINNLSRQMLAFALGRKLETFDQGALLKIQAALAANDFSGRTLIEEVVLSYPFLHQNTEPSELSKR